MNNNNQALKLHRKYQGKIEVVAKISINSKADLSLAYTPGVAAVSSAIAKKPELSYDLTWRGRTVAIVSDGSAVLGLGNIGPYAALPVMEGKALLLKKFAGVDAVPLVISTQEPSEIITFVRNIAPSFAGINLEDIQAPKCFGIETALQDVGIPVFHDDQHGTAIAVTAALKNASKVIDKPFTDLRITIIGAGAAGLAIAKMLLGVECTPESCTKIPTSLRVKDVILCDRNGIITPKDGHLNPYKATMAFYSNIDRRTGSIADALVGQDVVIGVSGPNTITKAMIKTMASKPIVFAMANPVPEIKPDDAIKAGAVVVATGRSDFPNQINNVLAFPAMFKAVIDGRLTKITLEHKQAAITALSNLVKKPHVNNIVPDVFSPKLVTQVSQAILSANTK